MSNSLGKNENATVRATRSGKPGWRDPRLWIGIAIVAASVIVGAKVIESADDTVGVWAVSDDLVEGDRVTSDALVATQIRFNDPADAARYLPASQPPPGDVRLSRGVGAGELLPRAALTNESDSLLQYPIAVDGPVPGNISRGSVVDVYAAPQDIQDGSSTTESGETTGTTEGELVFDDVRVLEAPRVSESFGAGQGREITVAVPQSQERSMTRAVYALNNGQVVVVGTD